MLLTKGQQCENDERFKDVAVKTNKLALKYAAAECFYGIGTDVSDLLADDEFSVDCGKAGVKCFGLGKQMQDTTRYKNRNTFRLFRGEPSFQEGIFN